MIATLFVRFKMLSSTVIYQLDRVVFRCEAFHAPLWPIIDLTHVTSANWKGCGKVGGWWQALNGWAWHSSRRGQAIDLPFHSLDATQSKHNVTGHTDNSPRVWLTLFNWKSSLNGKQLTLIRRKNEIRKCTSLSQLFTCIRYFNWDWASATICFIRQDENGNSGSWKCRLRFKM